MSGHAVLPTYEQALQRILEFAPVLSHEQIDLASALGRVLAEDIKTDRDQPPFDRSAMDGFAVQSDRINAGSADTIYQIIGSVPAGAPAPDVPPRDQGVLQIATGASVPPGYDAVIPIEQAQEDAENKTVRFNVDSAGSGQHIHRRATDAAAGHVVLRAGMRLGPQHLGIAAAVGAVKLRVYQQPRISLISTGDEVMSPATATDDLQPQQIRNSNASMLTGFFQSLGAPLLHHEHVLDEPEHTRAAAREALSHSHLVITVGGVSVGQRDFLPWAWKQLGLHTLVHGVAIKPGKPVFVAAPYDPEDPNQRDNKLVIGLPGNPVSVLATAHLFIWPIIQKVFGADGALPWRHVALAEAADAAARRRLFRAARLLEDGSASVIQWHGSGDLMHTADAHGLVDLPLQDQPVAAGQQVQFLPIVGAL